MPELPDVECFKRYLDATALHQTIRRVHVRRDDMLDDVSPGTLAQRLRGRTFAGTHRHGKHLAAALEAGGALMLHFGMTGGLRYAKGEGPITPHSRVVVTFDNGYRLTYESQRLLGRIALTDDVDAFIADADLGPDALRVDLRAFAARLAKRRGMIKSTLMNQSVIAGLGNLYTDEMLYQARVHPRTPTGEISTRTCNRLFDAMREVLTTAIDAQVDPQRFPHSWLTRKRTPGAPCPRGHGHIERIHVAGRSAYVCPQCQRL